MRTIVDWAISPMDMGARVSAHVARAVTVIADCERAYARGPMETSIEGDWDAVLAVVSRCMEALHEDSGRG